MWAPLKLAALALLASASPTTPHYLQRAPRALAPHGGYQDRHAARQAAACAGSWNGTALTGAAEADACRWTVRYGRAGRWEDSVAATQDGVDAAAFPKMCPQSDNTPEQYDEDCLFMTVYAPANATAESNLPVFVWIHGGSYVGGSASDAGLNGSDMAVEDGVVVVFLQYRLGVLGFLPPDGASTINDPNLAVRDVVLALNTVKNNIAGVGGDPTRVTVGGQSAGASLTRTLLAVPAAKDLFRGLVLQSDPINFGTQTFENAAGLRQLVFGNATLANCTGDCLKNVSVATILAVQEEVNAKAPFNVTGVPMGEVFRPQFNTTTLPVDPVSAIFYNPASLAVNVSSLPVLLTYTRNESGYLVDSFISGAQPANAFIYNVTINQLLGKERAKAFLDSGAYPLVAGPDGMRTSIEVTLTDAVWRCVSRAVGNKYAAAGGKIWVGEWTEGTTYSFNADAGGYCVTNGAVCHSDDIYPTFDSAQNVSAANAANATQLANDVRPLWGAFIKNGNPGESWKPYTAESTEADVLNIGDEHPLSTCPAGLWGDKVKWDWQLFSNQTTSPAPPPATSSSPTGGSKSGAPAGTPIAGAVALLSAVLGAIALL